MSSKISFLISAFHRSKFYILYSFTYSASKKHDENAISSGGIADTTVAVKPKRQR